MFRAAVGRLIVSSEEGAHGNSVSPAANEAMRYPSQRQEALDLPAAARPLEAGAHDLVLDDDERRHRRDAEALDEVRALLLVDPVELERAVVASALQYLGEEALDAAT